MIKPDLTLPLPVELGAVHFVGTLPHATMAAALAAADVVLNTSESEGESNALLEAQWAGRPVIARRNHGNVALVTDGVDGWLFDTPEELVSARAEANRQQSDNRIFRGCLRLHGFELLGDAGR